MLFLIGALRAVVEMIGLCLLAQGLLYLIAGKGRDRNLIYRFFAIITTPPCKLVRVVMPSFVTDRVIPVLTFLLLVAFWMTLAFLRKFV